MEKIQYRLNLVLLDRVNLMFPDGSSRYHMSYSYLRHPMDHPLVDEGRFVQHR